MLSGEAPRHAHAASAIDHAVRGMQRFLDRVGGERSPPVRTDESSCPFCANI